MTKDRESSAVTEEELQEIRRRVGGRYENWVGVDAVQKSFVPSDTDPNRYTEKQSKKPKTR